MPMDFVQSVFNTLLAFLQSFFSMGESIVANLFQFSGMEIGGFFVYWGNSFAGYGPLVPAVFALSIGITIAGLFAEFSLFDGGEKVVEAV